MTPLRRLLFLCVAMVALPGPPALAAATAFDGTWAVLLTCADTEDSKGPVKGYVYRFDVTIAEGAVTGTYGKPGAPASVLYTGTVTEAGTIDIVARGNTGRPEYSVARVAAGSNYGYTMQGKLSATTGTASRRELRPCTATFARR